MKKLTQFLDGSTYASKLNNTKILYLRSSSSQNQLFQTGLKTPEKSTRGQVQKTPVNKMKICSTENKENQNCNVSKSNSLKKYTKTSTTDSKTTHNLMKQISAKLTSKSSSVPTILAEKKDDEEKQLFNLTEQQRLFAQNRVIRIQDLFTSKPQQITIQELEKSCLYKSTQDLELTQSIQPQNNSEGNETLVQSQKIIEKQPENSEIYIIDLALL